jgi:hypothetical protein
MRERDENAAAPLQAEQTPAKAPMHEDVTTAPDETLTIACPVWETMLMHDMKVLQPELLILLEESLLRRPLLGHVHDDD